MKNINFVVIGILGIIVLAFFAGRFIINKNGKVVNDGSKVESLTFGSLGPVTNSEGAVTVQVTPIDLSSGSFEVVLGTHSVDIDEDLVQVAVLLGENGKEHKPISWDGDPPGGHHRIGILSFGKIEPLPKPTVLVIRQVGGIDERRFEWDGTL